MMIKIGDIVTVHYSDDSRFPDCEVLYIPNGPGDLWSFKAQDGSTILQNPQSSLFDCIIKKGVK